MNLIINEEKYILQLEDILREILVYFNRLQLDEMGRDPDRRRNPVFREKISLLNLLNEKSDEPGLTPEDLTAFNTTATEREADFTDRFCEFFSLYGIMLFKYDSGEVSILVNDVTRYQKLLTAMETIQSVVRVYFLRKVEMGLERSINRIMFSMPSGYSDELEDEMIEQHYGELLRHIPQIIIQHDILDPNPPEKNFWIRKRLILKSGAFIHGYFKDFMFLENLFKTEEVGNRSCMDYLSKPDFSGEHEFERWNRRWSSALKQIQISKNVRGVVAEPVIKKISENINEALQVLESIKVEDYPDSTDKQRDFFKGAVAYYRKEFERIAKLEMQVWTPQTKLESVQQETVKEKMDKVIDLINSYFFTPKELGILKRRIKKIKRRTDFPF